MEFTTPDLAEAAVSTRSLDSLVKRLHRAFKADRFAERPDAELIQRFCTANDPAAFEALVRRHGPLVLAACRAVLSSEADIEDAFQATFLVLLKSARSIRSQRSVGSWLYGVARRVALRARAVAAGRQRREQRSAHGEVEAPADCPSWREACEALHRELDRLPAKYRQPIWLCYFEGMSRDEAAAALGCTPGAVKGCLERGRELLRTRLARRGIALPASVLLTALANSPAGAVPPRLVETTLATVSGSPPAAVASLAKGVAMKPLMNKLVLALCATLGIALLGVGLSGRPAANAAREDPPSKAKAEAKPADEKEITISGLVFGPDGKPAAGARLYVPQLKSDKVDLEIVDERKIGDVIVNKQVGTADADGRFKVKFPPARLTPRVYLIAHVKGLGIDWVELAAGRPAPRKVTLRLPVDVPITWRVLTTEGKPVRGVRVRVMGVYAPPDDKLETFLTIWKTKGAEQALEAANKRVYGPLPPTVQASAVTDAAGRFTIRGFGAERIVAVGLSGAGIVRVVPFVVTRSKFDPAPYNDALKRPENEALRVLNRFAGLFPPDLTFVAAPGKVVEGVVTDADTGKPLAGCIVVAYPGYMTNVDVVTKADGRYRLTGLPQDPKGYRVTVAKRSGMYLPQVSFALDTLGTAPVRWDIKLAPGAVVAGRVIDPLTGKGVRVSVRLAPARGNPNFGGKPGSDFYQYNRGGHQTGADGRFRIVTIPGRSFVIVQAPMHSGGAFSPCPYRTAQQDPDHKDLFRFDQRENQWFALTASSSEEGLGIHHAANVVDVPKKGQVNVEVRLDRGKTRELQVQDAEGKPLAGAWVSGLSDGWPMALKLTGATGTVCGLGAESPRSLVLLHPEKQLGAVVTVKPDKKGPVVVKLEALGALTGTLRDADGEPVVGAAVLISPAARVGQSLYQDRVALWKPATTGSDGKFTLPGIVAKMPFYVRVRKGNNTYGGPIGKRTVKPGEKLDLGEWKMKIQR
jgi:RNA polymerase sigma factor (sigma-70 family)